MTRIDALYRGPYTGMRALSRYSSPLEFEKDKEHDDKLPTNRPFYRRYKQDYK